MRIPIGRRMDAPPSGGIACSRGATMNRIRIPTLLALSASALLATSGLAQTREAPKERPKEPPKEAPKERAPAGEPQKPDAPEANPREIAKKAAHFESLHRDRLARID